MRQKEFYDKLEAALRERLSEERRSLSAFQFMRDNRRLEKNAPLTMEVGITGNAGGNLFLAIAEVCERFGCRWEVFALNHGLTSVCIRYDRTMTERERRYTERCWPKRGSVQNDIVLS